MFKKIAISGLTLTGLMVLAVGSGGSVSIGGGAAQAACKRYIEAQNSVDCIDMTKMNPDTVCVAGLGDDWADYYDCMADGFKDYCKDGELNLDATKAIADCASKSPTSL